MDSVRAGKAHRGPHQITDGNDETISLFEGQPKLRVVRDIAHRTYRTYIPVQRKKYRRQQCYRCLYWTKKKHVGLL